MDDEQEEDFAALFEASIKTRRLTTGQTVDGVIVAIGPEVALVDVGAKGEASIALAELRNDDGVIEAKVGDRIQATIVSTSGGITLSRRLQRGAASRRQLEGAFDSGLPVEGKVESEVRGGFAVKVGGQRAFCPISQIDVVRVTDPAAHLGHVYTFRIIEFKDDGRTLVVSRRALLEAEQRARAEEVRKSITVDAVVKGRVVSVRDFGAFVDLGGGVQGLVHVSEMGWSRATKAADIVKVGDEITAKVLRIDAKDGEDRIALGLKQLAGDPWSAVSVTYAVGQVVSATVTRIAEFGAFVELEPGVEALAHVSTFAPTGRPGGWAKTIAVGATVTVEILNIDVDKRRIGVAIVEEGTARARSAGAVRTAIEPGSRLTGKVERLEKFGIFVFLAPGVTGLLPYSETGVSKDADLQKAFPVGSSVDVVVLEADPARTRIRLSVKAIQDAEEQSEVRNYAAREQSAEKSSGFGSLADKLRGALTPKR
jgi:small subunit ribosomal protein S1